MHTANALQGEATLATPHDNLVHFTFRHARMAEPWLRSFFPPVLSAAIDWTTFLRAGERSQDLRLRAHVADLVFVARTHGEARQIAVVVEHKAYAPADLHDQMLRYCVHLRHVSRRRGDPVAFVAPVLLHHGERPFASDPRGEQDAVAAAFAPFQPRLTFVTDDLTRCSERALRRAGLPPLAQLTLLCLAFGRRLAGTNVRMAIDRWGDLLTAVEADPGPPDPDDAITAIGWYLWEVTDITHEELSMAFSKHLQGTGEPLQYKSQRLRAEGVAEGMAKGQASTLLRMLTRRFGPLPPELESRVRTGSTVELDRWTDRVLDAATLPDVFTE